MCGVKVPKIMEVILLVGNFDRAIFMSVCPWGGGSKPNFRLLCRENNMLTAFQQGKMGAQLDWLAPRSCVVVNSWWERLKILQVIVILQWNLVLIYSDKNVTKRNVQEFSDVVSNPCEPHMVCRYCCHARVWWSVGNLVSSDASISLRMVTC